MAIDQAWLVDRPYDTEGASAPQRASPATEFSIQELTKALGLSARAIRFYEERALVRSRRSWAGRIFGRRDFQRLSIIARCRRVGLSLADAHDILAAYSPADKGLSQLNLARDRLSVRLASLDEQRAIILSEIDRLARR